MDTAKATARASTLLVAALLAACGSSTPEAGSSPSTGPTTSSAPSAPSSTSPTPSDPLASLFSTDASGVVRLTTTTCTGTKTGSGFLVGSSLIATVLHVVDGETAISVSGSGIPAGTTAVIVGNSSAGGDLALLRTTSPGTGHVLTLASSTPSVGARVVALGYPLAGPESLTEGVVSGLDRNITADSIEHDGVIQTDTAVNPGSSGGPLIDTSGMVVGVIDAATAGAQGINFAEPASGVRSLIASSGETGSPATPATCAPTTPTPPSSSSPPTSGPPAPAPLQPSESPATVLGIFFGHLIAKDYASAYAMYSPAGQQRIGDFTAWEASQSTTTITDPNLVSDTTLPDGDADLEVTFTSIQAPQYGPQPGQTCDQWDLDYILVPSSNGSWLVDIALPHSGSGYVPC